MTPESRSVLLLGCLVLSGWARAFGLEWKDAGGTRIPVPPAEHPRLYLRSSDLPDLRRRMEHPALAPVRERMEKAAGNRAALRWEQAALAHLLEPDPEAARRTIEQALKGLRDYTWDRDKQDVAREVGRMMVTGAIVYDWCNKELRDGEKQAFLREFLRLARGLECGYPPTRQGAVTGHSSEAMILRDLLSAGIAVHDDSPEMYELAATRIYREHVPVRNWFYPGGAHHQGDSYGQYRYQWEVVVQWILQRMGAGRPLEDTQNLVPYWWIYAARPDGQYLRSGDTYLNSTAPGRPWPRAQGFLLAAAAYGDGRILHHYLEAPAERDGDDLFTLLWSDPDLKPTPCDNLPLARYFGSPFGWIIARSAWGGDACVVEMKINETNFSNHQHADAGSFQVFYKGALAIDSGLYAKYGSEHDVNYYKRTVAPNSLLIHQPGEDFGGSRDRMVANDGGQRRVWREPANLAAMQSGPYTTGKVTARAIRDDIVLLAGDITAAYGPKAQRVHRTFAYLPSSEPGHPGDLVIRDLVSSADPSFRKTWLLHSLLEPRIEGRRFTVKAEEGGRLEGTVLLPEAAQLACIGGPGREFWVDGRNHPPDEAYLKRRKSAEIGGWRIEVSPARPSPADEFLTFLRIEEGDAPSPAPRRIPATGASGLATGGSVVLFAEAPANHRAPVTFTIDGERPMRVFVLGLAPGAWRAKAAPEAGPDRLTVESPAGLATFVARPGRYDLSPE